MDKFSIITNENKDTFRNCFISWMEESHSDIQHPNIIFSNIMYSIKNDIGFSINDLIYKKISLDAYKLKYTQYFDKINRKSPVGHASVQKWNAGFFLEYIYNNYDLG